MAELLIRELNSVGLTLNASKTKILHTEYKDDENSIDFVDIIAEIVEILHTDKAHRYLGRRLCLCHHQRISIEIKHKKQQTWNVFNKRKQVLLNKYVSLKYQLK